MDPRVKQKRIPTLLAFVLLAVGIGVTYLLVQRGTFIVSQAAPDYEPTSVKVSNVTDDSFVVSFVTADATVAGVRIEESERYILDNQGSGAELTTHYFTVDGLGSGTTYSFVIVSHGKEYRGDTYTATTAPAAESVPENMTLSGRVLSPSGGGAKGAVVYLSVAESQLVSTLTTADGSYSFDFESGLRTRDLAGFVVLEEGDKLNLVAEQGELSSRTTAYYSQILPPVTLGRNFDFTAPEPVTSPSTESGTLSILESGGAYSFSVTTPGEGDFLVDSRPIISGGGTPSTRVTVELLPLGISESVVVGETGGWEYRPSVDLPQGNNKLSAVGVDADGVSRVIEVNFDVFPDGSRVQQSATPSATPVVTVAPTAEPTPEVTVTPEPTIETPTPTVPVGGEDPTPVASPSPTLEPSPTITPFLKVTPTAPGSIGGVFLTFASLAFIVAGATLLFLLG